MFKNLPFRLKRMFQMHILWPLHRAKHGWAPNDVWNFDHHLSQVIIGGLQELMDMGHSYPSKYESFDKPLVIWHAALTDIIAAFKEREKFDDYMWEEHEKLQLKYEGKIPPAALKRYNQRMDEEYKAIQDRMRKLIDVYDNLWD